MKEPAGSLAEFVKITNVNFGIEKFLTKINEDEIENKLNSLKKANGYDLNIFTQCSSMNIR